MCFRILLLAAASALYGDDGQRLALVTQAESAFDRVQLAADPGLRDTAACVQAQAALLPVALPEELPVVHFRKGYCTLADAAITRTAGQFKAAAGEFDKAMGAWGDLQAARAANKKPVEPMSSGTLVLAALARLQAGTDEAGTEVARNAITAALAHPQCPAGVMPVSSCHAILRTGREWLGWLALRAGNVDQAAKDFAGPPESGWQEWVAGRKAFQQARYAEAAADYRQAIGLLHPEVPDSLAQRLGPPADRPTELTELGGAQLLAGDTAGAIATLDEAVKADPSDARAFFLRARARELAGQGEAALADYNFASRTAFANARDLASGEAHLYRGILLYRRKDYAHAEDEFASALNFTIGGGMRPDAVAWRHLAAVERGGCEASRRYLEQSLSAVSPYFPKQEALTAMAGCGAGDRSPSSAQR